MLWTTIGGISCGSESVARARMIKGWTDTVPLFRTTSRMPCSGMTCLDPCDETSSEQKTSRNCRLLC